MTTNKAMSTSAATQDFLAKTAKRLGQSRGELQAVRTWLADQLVAQEYAKLGQGGHTNTQVPLRQVFVDLPIGNDPSAPFQTDERKLFLSCLLPAEPLNLQTAFRDRSELAPTSLLGEEEHGKAEEYDIDAHCREDWGATLLIGGPGQGKSTLGQLACQLHRAALIRPATTELTIAQRDLVESFIAASCVPGETNCALPLGLPANPLLPLQISLPDFAAWAATATTVPAKEHLPSLILFLADMPSAKAANLSASTLYDVITAHPSLLVLDGFDEVGATQDRVRIVTAARELLTSLADKSASSQILATTRPQGYADELSQIGIKFQKVFLSPLQREEALEYARKLIAAKISGADQRAKALRQIEEAAAEPATERLLTTPLQVTILTALVQQLGRAPRERWNLFSRYFAYTFDREIERNTYASALLAEHRAHIERIHARVALLLQVEAERDGGASARMTRERLETVILEVLVEDEVAIALRTDLVRGIAEAAENRLVFLVEPEPGKFGFEIRSLQEFMAAWALTSGRDSEVEARLYQIAKAPMFRNVALFIASRLFSEGSPLRDILTERICRNLDEDVTDELSQLARAGARLALETLEEGAALPQPKRARALMARAVQLLGLPPSDEHIRLARAANADTVGVLRDALEIRLANPDREVKACSLSAWTAIIDSTNRNESWAIELGHRYWSNDVPSENFFSALSRAHIPLGEWICRTIENHSDVILPDQFLRSAQLRADSKSPSWTSWLVSIFGQHGHWRRRHRSGINPAYSSRASRAAITIPNYPPPKSVIWSTWIAAGNFEQVPTATNLAAALNSMAHGPSLEYWEQHLGWRASWPLAACISFANELSDLRKLAKQLKNGRLGSESQWQEAERSWNERFNPALLIEATDASGPWTQESLRSAPPFLAVPIWRLFDRVPFRQRASSGATIERANLLFQNSYSNQLRYRLSEYCLHVWRNLPVAERKKFPNPLEWVRCAPSSATFLIPRPKSVSKSAWKELLDSSNSEAIYPWLINAEDVIQSLNDLPTHPVLIKFAASAVGRYEEFLSISNDLNIEPAHTAIEHFPPASELNANLAVLSLYAGKHDTAHDDALISKFQEAKQSSPYIWQNVLGALRTGRLPHDKVSSLLGKIYSAIGPGDSDAHIAMRDIRNALQKLTSDLDSKSTWDRLALPLPYPQRTIPAKIAGGIPSSPVAIKSLDLQNIGGIQKLSFEFALPTEKLGQWIVIIGPNGAGKTTLLRSLAVALRSVKHPSIWPKGAFSSSWQRIPAADDQGISSSHILVTLGGGEKHQTLIRSGNGLSISQQPEQDRPTLLPVFAYGCRRGSALGGVSRQVNLNDDDGPEIATLFDEGADLLQAETWLVALEGDISKNSTSKTIYESVVHALKEFLQLDLIEVSNQRLWVAEKNGAKIPFSCLSDGYLTSAGWLLDLLARWLKLAERYEFSITKNFLSQMRGLVLIDEIDLHLHPQWQIEIISRTRELLPAMSFVVTTHNPLTLVGAEPEEIWRLETTTGALRALPGSAPPMLLTGGQIYRQYFEISDIYPSHIGRMLQRFSYLSGYALRNGAEQAELEAIQGSLKNSGVDPGWDVVPRDTSQAKLLTTKKRRLHAEGGKK